MMYYLQQASHSFFHWIFSMNRGEWLMLLLAVTVAGFMCLRGFGSRSNY